MGLKKVAMLSLVAISASPLFAYALDIHINNQTDFHGTGSFGFICSSSLGQKGIVQPQQVFTVPDSLLNKFCYPTCQAEIYLNDHCGGDSFATIDIDINKGVTHKTVHDDSQVTITGGGTEVSLVPASRFSKLLNWFK